MKLTNWFSRYVKPVHIGVYQRDSFTGDYSYWNGKFWCVGFTEIQELGRYPSTQKYASIEQNAKWRGLAYDPSKGKK